MARWMTVWFWLLGGIKSLLQRIPYVSRSFLVLSSGRSGSTLLMQYLKCHPSISCSYTEPLHEETLASEGLTGSNVTSSTLINYLLAHLLSWRRYSGCKIFCHQLELYRIPLAELLTALCDPPVVVLYRENLLETFVSLQLAFKTDVWYSDEEREDCATVEVDFDEYRHYAETEFRRWKSILSTFATRKQNRLYFLSYEELSEKKEEILAEVFSFLRLPPCKTVAFSRKQNPADLAKKIPNFEELKEKLDSFRGNLLTKDWMRRCTVPT